MSRNKITNLPLKTIRKFLIDMGCKEVTGKGGHEKWISKALNRPIILQSHIDPVPRHIVKQIINHFEISVDQLFDVINGNSNALNKSKYYKKRITIRGHLNHDAILDKINQDEAIVCDQLDSKTDYVVIGTNLGHQTYNEIKKHNTIKIKPRDFLKN